MTPTPEPRPPFADALDNLAARTYTPDTADLDGALVFVWPSEDYDNGRVAWQLAGSWDDAYDAIARAVHNYTRNKNRPALAALAVVARGTALTMNDDGTPNHDAPSRRVSLAHMIARTGTTASRLEMLDAGDIVYTDTSGGALADAMTAAAQLLDILPNPTNN